MAWKSSLILVNQTQPIDTYDTAMTRHDLGSWVISMLYNAVANSHDKTSMAVHCWVYWVFCSYVVICSLSNSFQSRDRQNLADWFLTSCYNAGLLANFHIFSTWLNWRMLVQVQIFNTYLYSIPTLIV